MKTFNETLKEIAILKEENKSKIRSVKLHMLKSEINNFETSFEYKKGRIYPGISEVESFEHDNLYQFFESEDLNEVGKRIRALKSALREASEA